jgi:hypothetical protein
MEARVTASELSPHLRAVFISAVTTSAGAGHSGLRAIWAGLAEVAGTARREAPLGKDGGTIGRSGVCEETET